MVGGSIIGRIIAKESRQDYKNFRKPPFSPPTKAFPIVWPILYLLMGVSYLITTKNKTKTTRIKSDTLYAVNFKLFMVDTLF